jgi:glycine/D-amino acid oxidase-like deaminating enzyme
VTARSRPDAVVVGAGIVGAACALALAESGLRVLVLEAGFAGGGTTAAGMGHLVAMDDSPAQLALTACALRLWSELSPELPADCEFERCGTLWIAASDEELALARAKAESYAACGLACEVLDAAALREAEPRLRAGLAGALRVAGDGVLYPPAAARCLLERARAAGAEVREGDEVRALAARRAVTAGGPVEADFVVNAAGVAAERLTPGLPIVPRKGHLIVTERAPGFARHQLVELGYLKSARGQAPESVAFNVQPRPGGQLLVGSSREYVGLDASVNRRLCSRMLSRAFEFLPGLRDVPALRTWTGFRPATPDKLPLIGEWEPGLWIAAGHEGLGITTAPATARLLAALVKGTPPPIDAAPYAPRRAMALA